MLLAPNMVMYMPYRPANGSAVLQANRLQTMSNSKSEEEIAAAIAAKLPEYNIISLLLLPVRMHTCVFRWCV